MITPGTTTGDKGTTVGTACRIGAAVAVLVSGLVHLQLYLDGYRDFPNQSLGRSFLLNVVASAVLTVALVWRRELVVRVAAAGLLASTLVAFALSRSDRGIFGFTERGLEPSPQAGLALAAEVLGLVLLAATVIPAVGAGDTLRLPVVVGAAGATVLLVVVGAALWSREAERSVTAASPSSTTPVVSSADTTGSSASPTTAVAPTTTSPGPAAGPTTTGAAAVTTTTTAAPTTTAPAESGVVTVSIQDFAFRDQMIEIPVGTTVQWVNEDSFAHSVVAEEGAFQSEALAPGATFSFTFDSAGTFAYICGIHPSMLGTVVVTA